MSEQEQPQQPQQPQQPTFTRDNSGRQIVNESSGYFQDYNNLTKQASQALKEGAKTAGKAIYYSAGGDTLEIESIGGKTTIWIFIGLSIAILIYIIVIAVWANSWFSSYVCKDETAEVKTYIYTDDENKEHEYTATFQDNFMRTLNVNKLIINCLLSVTALFGIVAFYGIGVGSGIKTGKGSDGKDKALPVCGGKTFFWYFIPAITWFVLNCVWDMQHNTRYPAPKEGFCGMVETFCGNVSESFSNMKKAALRKF